MRRVFPWSVFPWSVLQAEATATIDAHLLRRQEPRFLAPAQRASDHETLQAAEEKRERRRLRNLKNAAAQEK